MDFQAFVDQVAMPCAVLSVERVGDGWGEIRILRANRPYRETMGPAYRDGMLYQDLVPQDEKFEDFCFRAAVGGRRMRAYVEVKALNCWIDQQLIPLAGGDDRVGYCQFLFEYTDQGDPSRMASVSMSTASVVLRACITLMDPSHPFLENLGTVLDDLVETSGGIACRIMLIDHRTRTATNFCERFSPTIRRTLDPATGQLRAGDLSYEIVDSWEAMIGVSNDIILKDERDMELLEQRNPLWAASLRDYHIRSMVLIPLRREREVIGYLYVVNFDVKRLVEVKELTELMSYILGAEISSHLLMAQLNELSHTDLLTGVNNRNAMIRRMRALKDPDAPRVPFGVVNLDLNGLKTVNDRDGHDAGDRMLIRAAQLLKDVFQQRDLYRTGGDEFVVITEEGPREAFQARVDALRTAMEADPQVSFAIGACWSEGDMDPREVFPLADECMYADKDAFYRDHPELHRR